MGRGDLGLTDAEFGSLTPALVYRLHRKWLERCDREDRRWGVLYTILANAHRDTEAQKTPFELSDFFRPVVGKSEPDKPSKRVGGTRTKAVWQMTPEEQEELLQQNLFMAQSFAAACGPVKNRKRLS